MSEDKGRWHDDVPFPRRWIAYALIKLAVLALAAWLVLRWYGIA